MKVIKFDHSEEPFDFKKIHNYIKLTLPEQLDVSIEKLEMNIKLMSKKQITTTEINQLIINAALRLTTKDEPDYKYLAARIRLLEIYSKANTNRFGKEFRTENYFSRDQLFDRNENGVISKIGRMYLNHLNEMVSKGLYFKDLFNYYNEIEILNYCSLMKREYDFIFDFNGINLYNKDLVNVDGKIVELPQEIKLFSILNIAKNINDKKERETFIIENYLQLAKTSISLSTPMEDKLRKEEGNLTSCYILAINDDIDSIFYSFWLASLISKSGGGIGVYLSMIRAHSSWVKKHKNAAKGVMSWVKIIDDICSSVDQLGKRDGAITVALDIWHNDLFKLLDSQKRFGDQKTKTYKVMPQISILDFFMELKEDIENPWFLFDPYEVKEKFGIELYNLLSDDFKVFYYKILKNVTELFNKYNIDLQVVIEQKNFENVYESILSNESDKSKYLEILNCTTAYDVWEYLLKTEVDTGKPYMFFKDTVNKVNPNKDRGLIYCANLCVESFSNFTPTEITTNPITKMKEYHHGYIHSCNLVSVNLTGFNLDDNKECEKVMSSSVDILNRSLLIRESDIIEANNHNKDYNTIGIGYLGFADCLAVRNLAYNKEEARIFARKIFEKLAYYTFKRSMEWCKELGFKPFKYFKESELSKGIILGKNKEWFIKNSSMSSEWCELIDNIMEYGIYNSQLMAIAPNTSSGGKQGVNGSVLPVYSNIFVDQKSESSNIIISKYIKNHLWYYPEMKNMNMNSVIDMISIIQEWIDSGISMELVVDLNRAEFKSAIYLDEIYTNAWKKKCKTVYYSRWIPIIETKKDDDSEDKLEINNVSSCLMCNN